MDITRHGPIVSNFQRDLFHLFFSKEEVKEAIWSIPDDKSPSLDGFNSAFYKSFIGYVGDDIVQAINQFCSNGKMS